MQKIRSPKKNKTESERTIKTKKLQFFFVGNLFSVFFFGAPRNLHFYARIHTFFLRTALYTFSVYQSIQDRARTGRLDADAGVLGTLRGEFPSLDRLALAAARATSMAFRNPLYSLIHRLQRGVKLRKRNRERRETKRARKD